jgi:flap endonuclease-1
MFVNPEVTDGNDLTISWDKPKEEELKKFLVEDKSFQENRIESGLKRLKACQGKSN